MKQKSKKKMRIFTHSNYALTSGSHDYEVDVTNAPIFFNITADLFIRLGETVPVY